MLTPAVLERIRTFGFYGVGRDLRALPMELLEAEVVRLLDPKRVPHVLGCRDTAAKLAEQYGANVTDAARAGLLRRDQGPAAGAAAAAVPGVWHPLWTHSAGITKDPPCHHGRMGSQKDLWRK